MHVGVMRLVLSLPGARSLKDRRQVVRSFKERVKGRLGVSIAEVAPLDRMQLAAFGVAVVSNDATVCEAMLGKVVAMADALADALVVDRAVEIVPFGGGGGGVRGGLGAESAELLFDDDDAASEDDEDDDEEG